MVFGAGTKADEPRKRRKFGAAALGGGPDEDSDGEGQFHPHGFAKWGPLRQKIYGILSNEKLDWILATMILSSVVNVIVDADLFAKENKTQYEQDIATLTTTISTIYTCIYAIEMAARVYVFRSEVFQTAMLLDFCIVATDVLLLWGDFFLSWNYELGFLRIFRLARLFRFVRVVGMFPELQFLVKGFISSFSAVFWGSILMWVVILMWAIVAVYFLDPILRDIAKNDAETCEFERNCTAWSSVFDSVVTLTQTVVFGDSWGSSAIAIITKQPQTMIIFAGMYATVTLGVLNLIVAAIVDSGAQAREEAQEAKKRRQRNEEQKQKERQKNRLLEICKILDDDESGSLSFDELIIGFDRNTEFRNAMKDYNIDRKDLDVLFRVFDEAGTGVLDYQEFFNLIDSAREQASQQVLTFVRFAVMDLRQQLQAGQDMIKSELATIKEFVVEAENSLNERLCRLSGETAPPKKTVPGTGKGNTRNSGPVPTEKKAPPQPPASTSVPVPKRTTSAKSSEASPATTVPKAKPDGSRSASPVSRHLSVPGGEAKEKPAPIQQLVKMNKELLKGMKRLLEAHQMDFSPTMVGRLHSDGSDSREVSRIDSCATVKTSMNSFRSSGEMEKGQPREGEQRTSQKSASVAQQAGYSVEDPSSSTSSSAWLPAMPAIPSFAYPKVAAPDERRTAI